MNQLQIPILDLSSDIDRQWKELNDAFQRVLKSGQFIMGPSVKAFEAEVAGYLGVKHAIGLNSGTDALVIGLRALGVGAGDEVITTPFTFFATAEAISHLGAVPRFVDIDPRTFNIDVEQIARQVGPKTRAIIPVHLFGHAAEMDQIQQIAQSHGLKVLEDVAQAFGGTYKSKKLGTIGNVGAFSFFPSKNLGGFGDGGLLTTQDDGIAEMTRKLRTHGSLKKYHNEVVGYNSRLDELQAALLQVKLKYIGQANEGRRRAARRYNDLLAKVADVETPVEHSYAEHVFHQYTVRVKGGKRDHLHERLSAAGVGTMVYYPVPVHQLPVYRHLEHPPLPVSERAAQEVISLPIWPEIPSEVQSRVVDAIRSAL